jgi:hypothetical protein
MPAHIKAPYLLAMARKLSGALRNDAHIRHENESEEDHRERRNRIEEQSARVLDMLAAEFERISLLNIRLGEYFECPKKAPSSFSTRRHSGNASSN